MNPSIQRTAFCATVLLGALALTGCATTGMDRAAKSTTSMQTVEGDYRQASLQIDATRMALEDLTKTDQGDVKKAYGSYAANVDTMEKQGKRLETHTKEMSARGNEYFTQWESSYSNPEIRELSEQRRIDMRELYAKIPEASIGANGALKAYLTDIKEIQRYLSNDLTPQGIGTIGPVAQRAIQDGEGLKERIKRVLGAIDQVKAGMTQGGMSKDRSEALPDATRSGHAGN